MKYKSDIKKTWTKINEFLGKKNNDKGKLTQFINANGKTILTNEMVCKEFNSFFASAGKNLANSINATPKNSFSGYLKNKVTSYFNFKYITQQDIINIAKSLNLKNSCGYDDISTKLLYNIIPSIAYPISIILNQCYHRGIFPDKLKIAKVIPLYKKDDPSSFNNYRPISLLPAISKIFEKSMHLQILEYFEQNNLLYKSQYGFKPLHSCELAALELVDRIHEYIDRGNDPFAIFLDLSKAFDTLNHDILIHKLKYYGFNTLALNLCESYLKERKQYVEYDKTKSEITVLDTGVPQGSILGPLLFIIYVNDLPNVCTNFIPIMYADDTTLLSCRQVFAPNGDIENSISNELIKYVNWLNANKLSLNVAKTKIMSFRTPQKKTHPLDIKLNGENIVQVQSFNFLGIVLDEKLNWHEHVHHISIKISRANGILCRLKNVLPKSALMSIYHALIGSHINYGILVWGSNRKRINILQKKAIRIINNKEANSHTAALFPNDKLLKLADMITLKEYIFYFKLKNDLLPSYFTSFMPITVSSAHNYHTRSTSFSVPFTKKEYCTKRLRITMIKTINIAPKKILTNITMSSLAGFKRIIKDHIFESYLNAL